MLGHLAFAINNKKIVRSKAQVQIGTDWYRSNTASTTLRGAENQEVHKFSDSHAVISFLTYPPIEPIKAIYIISSP